jgi:hypothetical protein
MIVLKSNDIIQIKFFTLLERQPFNPCHDLMKILLQQITATQLEGSPSCSSNSSAGHLDECRYLFR